MQPRGCPAIGLRLPSAIGSDSRLAARGAGADHHPPLATPPPKAASPQEDRKRTAMCGTLAGSSVHLRQVHHRTGRGRCEQRDVQSIGEAGAGSDQRQTGPGRGQQRAPLATSRSRSPLAPEFSRSAMLISAFENAGASLPTETSLGHPPAHGRGGGTTMKRSTGFDFWKGSPSDREYRVPNPGERGTPITSAPGFSRGGVQGAGVREACRRQQERR